VLWTANTEETLKTIETLDELDRKIDNNDKMQSSVLYCYAAMQEGVTYLNGSP